MYNGPRLCFGKAAASRNVMARPVSSVYPASFLRCSSAIAHGDGVDTRDRKLTAARSRAQESCSCSHGMCVAQFVVCVLITIAMARHRRHAQLPVPVAACVRPWHACSADAAARPARSTKTRVCEPSLPR